MDFRVLGFEVALLGWLVGMLCVGVLCGFSVSVSLWVLCYRF